MDRLRVAATRVAERAARSRPLVYPRVMEARFGISHEDSERGQGLAEYALILALIGIAAIVSLAFLGGAISDLFWAPINVEFAAVLSSLGI